MPTDASKRATEVQVVSDKTDQAGVVNGEVRSSSKRNRSNDQAGAAKGNPQPSSKRMRTDDKPSVSTSFPLTCQDTNSKLTPATQSASTSQTLVISTPRPAIEKAELSNCTLSIGKVEWIDDEDVRIRITKVRLCPIAHDGALDFVRLWKYIKEGVLKQAGGTRLYLQYFVPSSGHLWDINGHVELESSVRDLWENMDPSLSSNSLPLFCSNAIDCVKRIPPRLRRIQARQKQKVVSFVDECEQEDHYEDSDIDADSEMNCPCHGCYCNM